MKTNFWKSAAAFVVGMAAMVACDSTEIQAPADPTFPSLITNNYVGAGETLEISFDANYAWDVEVSDESYAYFKLIDGEQEVQKISGAAGAGQSVKVKVTKIADDNHSYVGEIYMTMNGITKKVAYYVLPGKLTTVSLYPAVLEEWKGEWDFAYNEDFSSDLTYAYETSQTSTVELINLGGYYPAEQRCLMEAHFDWTVEKDDWLTVMIQGDSENEKFGTPGTHEIWFRVDPAVYPANGADTKITFKKAADQSVVAEYRVILQPAPVSIEVSNMYAPLTFDQSGRIKTYMGYEVNEEESIHGEISGTKNVRIVAVENVNGTYAEASWVNLTVSPWDAEAGNDGIQTREFSVSVEANSGAERSAVIFALPETYANVALSQLFDANGVKEEYAKYAVSLTQVVLDYITFNKSNEELASSFASYEKVTADHANASLLTEFNTNCIYKLTYADPYAFYDATFSLLSEFATYEILDAAKQPATTEDFWVTLEGDPSYGYNVTANFYALPEVPEAYVVFKDAEGAVLGVIYVVKGEKAPGTIVGNYASMFGPDSYMTGSMVELTSGEVYEKYKSYGCPIFHLTYASWALSGGMGVDVVIPSYDSYEVTETQYTESYMAESMMPGSDPTIMMMLPEDVMNDSAVLVFKKGEAVVFVLQCTYAMPA